ncbi:hypothetical protein LOZ66_004895 [Ophidiomyces ophidiicola]|nr:hypothetical protein LOZ66_004895 [Ophidiomyces ophidiicola]
MFGVTVIFGVLALLPCLSCVQGMRERQVRELRIEAEHMFFHGFDNYMKYAFPEDELRPLSCGPLTRDRENPAHIELNDVLGNYSLTLVDSLSTLAILSDATSKSRSGWKAWEYFQNGVKTLVELYGDGSSGAAGTGSRGKGFEFDSKVQVFETVIRGVGGLLSAHLFAVGELPIRGYTPTASEASFAKEWDKKGYSSGSPGIRWNNGFVYNGQLLRLALDLGTRLLPAFYTPTGLPYPRVNLRDGVPFYPKSPLNANTTKPDTLDSEKPPPREITETCSAGAGSLVLEFAVLSRLTGDGRFEEFAKRAFWSVWMRRSEIDLIGAGIDAESGKWVNSYTGIGAGIDSFFEYALKSHILLSEGQPPRSNKSSPFHALDGHFVPLPEEVHSSDAFLKAWQQARSSIKHHLYRGSSYQYPHYIQGDILTGATRAFWMDSLSAYFPGLLTLSGNVKEAAETHLLTAALWTRFSALPERWNVATGDIEGGLTWWGGRPEFIESTYYLYQATKDPWYLHVGEMVLRDIKRRCWTKCGWAGIQDVRNGELSDRMESFFLGETAKYLYLLFEPSHPLNHLDAPFVFTTEGHPLIIPRSANHGAPFKMKSGKINETRLAAVETCPRPSPLLPFGLSSVAARSDLFHAASLAKLQLIPPRGQGESAIVEYSEDHPSVSLADLVSPSNYTYFPWTLPTEVVPPNATSAPMARRPTLDLSFPPMPNSVLSSSSLERVEDGILIKALGGLRLGMIQDVPLYAEGSSSVFDGYRIQVINNIPVGKDERVYVSRESASVLEPTDPNFTQVEDLTMLDIVIDVKPDRFPTNASSSVTAASHQSTAASVLDESHRPIEDGSNMKLAFSSFMSQVTSLLRDEVRSSTPGSTLFSRSVSRLSIPATTSTGKGAVPLPDSEEATFPAPWTTHKQTTQRLPWSGIYIADELCDAPLSSSVPRTHQVIVLKRGKCSFSQKLRRIPAFRPTRSSLQLVIVVSYPETGDSNSDSHSGTQAKGSAKSPKEKISPFSSHIIEIENESLLVRPLLDEIQVVGAGVPRPRPISMVMVGGGDRTYDYFRHALGVGIRRRYEMKSQGVPITNLLVV